MPTRDGWDFAQLKSDFLADPEFQLLSRFAPDHMTFLAAGFLWTIALAQAWRDDNDDVSTALANDTDLAALLERAGLVVGGRIRGFEKWTEKVRAIRAGNRKRQAEARARGAEESRVSHIASRVTGRESHHVTPREVEVEVEEESKTVNVDPLDQPPRAGPRPGRQRVKVRGFTRPFEEGKPA